MRHYIYVDFYRFRGSLQFAMYIAFKSVPDETPGHWIKKLEN